MFCAVLSQGIQELGQLVDRVKRTTMERKDIERLASDLVTNWMDNMAKGHPDEITAQWLMEMHPELDAEEAEEYRLFLMRNTFVFRGCYGDGSIWWPRWLAFKAEIKSL